MAKTIFSVGFEIPGGLGTYVSYNSDRSLLDADIILFQPDLSHYFAAQQFQGLSSYGEDTSFSVRRAAEHWQTELEAAISEGKTVLVFLVKKERFFLDTGERKYSGTGRNQKVTNIVSPSDNFAFLPSHVVDLTSARGELITPTSNLGFLRSYWAEFGVHSHYEVYITGDVTTSLLTAGSGNRVVGALISEGKGSLILLPCLDTQQESFTREDAKTKKTFWTKEGEKFGHRLIAAINAIDTQLRTGEAATPEPSWSNEATFELSTEQMLRGEVEQLNNKIELLQSARNTAVARLRKEGLLRRLLYETGKPLEEAIVEALRILGFTAEQYKDSASEFDVVFASEEGRFLGEAEGKDSKPVSIEKFSQLERNLHEDFARECVSELAHGVLFGNAFRLLPLKDRPAYFTEKCVAAAKRVGASLVRTPDLFFAVQYLKGSEDFEFAKTCREAILSGKGDVVVFPAIPSSTKSNTSDASAA